MNQRLEQLRLEACHHAKAQYPNDIVKWSMCMSERFAELIVRECAYFSMVATDDHYDVEALYKHFGVEP